MARDRGARGGDEDEVFGSRGAEGIRRGVSAVGYTGTPSSSSFSCTIASGKRTLLLGGDGSGVGGSSGGIMISGLAGDVEGSFCTPGRGAGGGTDTVSAVPSELDGMAFAPRSQCGERLRVRHLIDGFPRSWRVAIDGKGHDDGVAHALVKWWRLRVEGR